MKTTRAPAKAAPTPQTETAPQSTAGPSNSEQIQQLSPRRVNGNGGYVYEQSPTGVITIIDGPNSVGVVFSSGPAFRAITAEIGPYPTPAIESSNSTPLLDEAAQAVDSSISAPLLDEATQSVDAAQNSEDFTDLNIDLELGETDWQEISERMSDPWRRGEKGNITFQAEGQEGGRFHSRRAHWPGGASGVTIGRGYDMKMRSAQHITEDLIAAGCETANAEKLAEGAGLTETEAEAFCKRSDLSEIDPLTQKNLFNTVYLEMSKEVVRLCTKPDVVAAYGFTDFATLNPAIMECLIDLRFRGDYHPKSRRVIQKFVVANDISGLKNAIQNDPVFSSVPELRNQARVDLLTDGEGDELIGIPGFQADLLS